MQNSNQPDNPQNPKAGLPKNFWLILAGVALVLLVLYWICSEPKPPVQNGKQLSFDPLSGIVVADSLGNKNAHVNPGEQVKIRVRLTNSGDKPIPAFDLVLATADTAVTLLDNRLHFNGIDPKQTALSEDFFEFKLDEVYFLDCIRFTSTIARPALAGFIATAYAQNGAASGPPIDVYAYPNFRVCLGPCTLDIGTGRADLAIEAGLCNDGFTNLSKLEDVAVKITSVKLCVASVTFSPVVIEGVPLDNFDYGDVGINECGGPLDSAERYRFFTTTPLPQINEATVCIHFYVEIFKSAVKVGDRNLGIKAEVRRPEDGIAAGR